MKKQLISFLALFSLIAVSIFTTISVFAASADGTGPWADEVITSNQLNTKGGVPVSTVNPDRSDPQSAVGEAEDDNVDSHFFSLGFGGSITLRFDNGISDGIFVVESTNPGYPLETAQVELSTDGSTWTVAGTVTQDGTVDKPAELGCAAYVRITDTSNPDDFVEDNADGYDVDGVRAEGEICTVPTPTPSPTPTPPPDDGGDDNNDNNGNGDEGDSHECTAEKPGTPSITSTNRTSDTTVELAWTAADHATHYSIEYGTSSGNYSYGVANTGNTTSYAIGGLAPGAAYYFRVRAVNDCMPGDPSGESSTGGGAVLGASIGGQVLGASTLASTGVMDEVAARAQAVIIALFIFALGYIYIHAHEKNCA